MEKTPIITNDDVKRLSELGVIEHHDGAYRRGYSQGYWQAMKDSEKFSIEQMDSFMESLQNWRYCEDLKKMINPPLIRESGA